MTDELKQCPDCAESVRAAARVCRFCGYRFDGRPRSDRGAGAAGSGSAAGALAQLLRRPNVQRTLPEILENWGLELALEEAVAYFGYCRLERTYGFLLVTTRRMAFFSGRAGERLLDWPLAEIRAVERTRRRAGGDALRVGGPDGAVRLGRLVSRQALDDVARLLGGG